MKLALTLIASWIVASVPISILLGTVLKRLDVPMRRLQPVDPSFLYSLSINLERITRLICGEVRDEHERLALPWVS